MSQGATRAMYISNKHTILEGHNSYLNNHTNYILSHKDGHRKKIYACYEKLPVEIEEHFVLYSQRVPISKIVVCFFIALRINDKFLRAQT